MSNKNMQIMVCMADTIEQQQAMISKLAVRLGFARIVSDARKLVRSSIIDYDFSAAYFMMATGYSFSRSQSLNQELYRFALGGMCIIVGCRKVPPELRFMCDIYHESDL